MIIFLHGGGERNNNPNITAGSPVWNIQNFGPSRLVSLGYKMDFTWNGQVDTQLLEEATAELLRTGDISRHIKKSYRVYQARLENTCRLLSEHLREYLTFDQPNGGLAIWAMYRQGISAGAVARNAGKLGLKLSDGSNYFFQPNVSQPHDFIRIGYSSLDEREMAAAIDIWKRALSPFA
ncbi:hypothetical protein L3C95_24115 [Chitinophaga filiformis]|nr:hypothetical protein [Chitinophaga filiformis]